MRHIIQHFLDYRLEIMVAKGATLRE